MDESITISVAVRKDSDSESANEPCLRAEHETAHDKNLERWTLDPRVPNAYCVPLDRAVGLVLAHDVTEIVPGVKKGPAFRKGHIVGESDLPHLARLGKRQLYVLELDDAHMHEDDAVALLVEALCGDGVVPAGAPREGKVELVAARDGLLEVDVDRLVAFNEIPDVMCATRHRHTPVRRGDRLAGTRIIPLVAARARIEEACAIAGNGLLEVRPWRRTKAGLVITGTEVAEGLVEDRFEPIVTEKLLAFGCSVLGTRIVPDTRIAVSEAIRDLLTSGADLVITTAGMSVDPDDVTRLAIADAGGRDLVYGSPVLPGAMLLVGLLDGPGGEIPVIGVPACALYYRSTAFDLVLPRILAGEPLTRGAIARLSHGGYCTNCEGGCRFPSCAFGRGA